MFALLALSVGCHSPPPTSPHPAERPQGLDRAVLSARESIQDKYPEADLANFRLRSIIALDRVSNTNRKCMVVFEDLQSIQVTTNDGRRTRSVQKVSAHVADDGRVTSVGESRGKSTGRIRR